MTVPAAGVVTDSTSGLAGVEGAVAFASLPLTVTIGDDAGPETPGLAPTLVEAMEAGTAVSTSMPSVGDFATAYREMAASGVTQIVSVHLSGKISGTVDSARTAAEAVMGEYAGTEIVVVDSATTGAGLAAAARLAALRLGESPDAHAVAGDIVAWCRDRTRVWFLPSTLEHLRRGGRIGAAAALVGQALSIRPILGMIDGVVTPVAKVRTLAKARGRLRELALAAAGEWEGQPLELVVQHLGADEAAAELAESLGGAAGEVRVTGISAVLAAHVGPGVLAVTVSALR